jgi:hypothetical protein
MVFWAAGIASGFAAVNRRFSYPSTGASLGAVKDIVKGD